VNAGVVVVGLFVTVISKIKGENMLHELPAQLHEQISSLCKEGDALSEQEAYESALNKYREAWDLVPAEKINWEASTWILASAGEVYFRQRNYEKALNCFLRAVQGVGGLGNPYIHLRLGQLHYETGDMDLAADELARAFMGAGDELFSKEDPKYQVFIHARLRPEG
jgi:tetratricopeptide (TPR) repeat protein